MITGARMARKRTKEIPAIDRMRSVHSGTSSAGTGATILKLQSNPIARLIDKRLIGAPEMQAAEDICRAFYAITGALQIKPMSWERQDKGHDSITPAIVLDAIGRYRAWAEHWSSRTPHGDRTLEIVIAAVIDERSFTAIDLDVGVRRGTAQKATVRGLRDYAARAEWVDRPTAARWKAEASCTFNLAARILAAAMAKASAR